MSVSVGHVMSGKVQVGPKRWPGLLSHPNRQARLADADPGPPHFRQAVGCTPTTERIGHPLLTAVDLLSRRRLITVVGDGEQSQVTVAIENRSHGRACIGELREQSLLTIPPVTPSPRDDDVPDPQVLSR